MKYKINLINRQKKSFFDSLIFFLLNYLRYILVITQIIVIAVFFYKFQVDQQIIDLKESVDQKKEIITISQPLIKEAKTLDLKMGYLDSIMKNQDKFDAILVYFLSRFPDALWLKSLSIKENTVLAQGYGPDASIIRAFYERLKKDNKFKKVELKNITKDIGGYVFSLNMENF